MGPYVFQWSRREIAISFRFLEENSFEWCHPDTPKETVQERCWTADPPERKCQRGLDFATLAMENASNVQDENL